MTPETYLGVHLRFLLPPILLLAALYLRRPLARRGRVPLVGLGVVVLFAVVYTTPWDNLLVVRGVWHYGEGVTAARLWAAPVGEYLFFLLQPLLTALWLAHFRVPTDGDLRLARRTRAVGAAAGLGVGAFGLAALVAGPATLYLGALLVWAGPVLAVQWAFGWPQLWRTRRVVAVGVAVPTAYLWALDRAAIDRGLWVISETHTVGVTPLGLPIEEALFFLVTNLFVVQGLVLYLWLAARWPTVAPDIRAAVPPSVASLVPSGPARTDGGDRPGRPRR